MTLHCVCMLRDATAIPTTILRIRCSNWRQDVVVVIYHTVFGFVYIFCQNHIHDLINAIIETLTDNLNDQIKSKLNYY